MPNPDISQTANNEPQKLSSKLFGLGFLTLFLELALIRYLSGSIWNLGYFPNLVLLAVFMGLGIGFTFHTRLSDRQSDRVFLAVPTLLLILTAFVALLHPGVPGMGGWSGDSGGELFFTGGPQVDKSEHLGLLGLWFFMIVAVFSGVAQKTAKWFSQFPPLHAYTLDIGGSCCGIIAFMAISFAHLPAWSWFLGLMGIYAGCLVRPFAKGALAWILPLALCVAGIAYQDTYLEGFPNYTANYGVTWSPYQKLGYVITPDVRQILVNGLLHQHMDSVEMIMNPNNLVPYSIPYLQRSRTAGVPPYKRVLILGAGSGNDVTAALRHGVEHVDAVDIDPVIMQLGKRYHPGKPYDDPRVRATVDDGRAVLTRSTEKYDLIIFALTDSLVKVSPMSQLRLENYLFTENSVRRAWKLLEPQGSLMFYNFYRYPWLVEKIQNMIVSGTGHKPEPLLSGDSGFQMLLVSQNSPEAKLSGTADTDLPTDDWPFLYLKNKGIPTTYQFAGALVAATILVLMYFVHRTTLDSPSSASTKIAFSLMGTAFMLLESKTVIQFSLLFGTTWLNNSLVFLAVLVMVLLANWTALAIDLSSRRNLTILFVMLLASCMLPLVFPLARLLEFDNAGVRFILGSLLSFSPIFFGNLLFSTAFRNQPAAEQLFGWNLIGSSLGGILEYSSLAYGYNALAWLVATCYILAFAALSMNSIGRNVASK